MLKTPEASDVRAEVSFIFTIFEKNEENKRTLQPLFTTFKQKASYLLTFNSKSKCNNKYPKT